MKKFFTMVAVVLITATSAQAQSDELKNEIGVFYGIGSVTLSCENDVKKADPDAKDETKVSIAFQLTALGAEFGGSAFRGFVEAGFGEKGTLCAGLRYKF